MITSVKEVNVFIGVSQLVSLLAGLLKRVSTYFNKIWWKGDHIGHGSRYVRVSLNMFMVTVGWRLLEARYLIAR